MYNLLFMLNIVPSAPRNFMLTSVPNSPTHLSASWMIPHPTNGNISFYSVSCRSPSGSFNNFSFDGSVTSTLLRNLLGYTKYNCSVSAATSIGEGNPSDYQAATTALGRKLTCIVHYIG